MTNEQWLKEAERLAMDFAHCYAFVGDDTMPKAKAALLAHLQQRPLTDLQAAIMNLPCNVPKGYAPGKADEAVYRIGHRDARHAAAELVARPLTGREVTDEPAAFGTLFDIAMYGDRGNATKMRQDILRLLRLYAPSLPVREEPTALHPNHLPDLRYALDALKLAREAIEPLTEAQIKLHRIKRDTDERIESAIVGMRYIIKRTEEATRAPSPDKEEATGADGVEGRKP